MVLNKDYGIQAAKRRAAKKVAKLEITDMPKLSKRSNDNIAPQLDWMPLLDRRIKPFTFINWSDESTNKHADYLINALHNENEHAQLVVMPTGTGKTAVAVQAIAKYQKLIGETIPFVVTSTSKAIDKMGKLAVYKDISYKGL